MNDGYTHSEIVDHRSADRRLDAYLSQRYTHSTLTQWRARILDGQVQLDGVRAVSDEVLRRGQLLAYHRPAWEEPDAPLRFAVLYQSDGALVVHKPAGLPTLPGGGFLQNTLLHQVRLQFPEASPMHRLGRWTSGAMLCSRSAEAGASIAAQFAARTVTKRYRALVSGRLVQDSFAVDIRIAPVPYPPLGTLHAAHPHGRRASSEVWVIERREASSLCDVRIATGRPHQIRIHLAAVGHPLVGDPLYGVGGGPLPGGAALPGDPGYSLHSAEIGFEDPATGARETVQAPPPPELCSGLSVGLAG